MTKKIDEAINRIRRTGVYKKIRHKIECPEVIWEDKITYFKYLRHLINKECGKYILNHKNPNMNNVIISETMYTTAKYWLDKTSELIKGE